MSGIDLYLDFNGDRIRISGAKLRSQADADELIEAISIVRRLLPDASEKAVAVPPAGEDEAPTSPAPITEAPKPLPDSHETLHRPAEVKTSDQDALSSASGGMQDEETIHPATLSLAGKTARAKAFVVPRGEQAERTMKRIDVSRLHDAEPWLTPDEAASRVQIPVVNLRIFSDELEITWSHPRPQPAAQPRVEPMPQHRTLMQRVVAVHRMHPTWTAALIAKELGAARNSVSAYLSTARKIVAEEQAAA